MEQRRKHWRVIQGLVDTSKPHIKIIYKDQSSPYVLLQPGGLRTLILETLLLPGNDFERTKSSLEAVIKEIKYYVLELNTIPDPWQYSIYHCSTDANLYSDVHWGWYPGGEKPPMFKNQPPESTEGQEGSKSENDCVRENAGDYCPIVWPKMQQKVAEHFLAEGDHSEAILAADTSLKNDPLNPYAWYIKGFALAQIFRFDRAIEALTQAIRYAPKRPEPYAERGYCYFQLDDPPAAFENYDRAIRLDSKEPAYRELRGHAYMRQGCYAAAIKDFTAALQYNKTNPDLFLSRAEAFTELGDTARAEKDFKRVLAMEPDNLLAFAQYELLKANLTTRG